MFCPTTWRKYNTTSLLAWRSRSMYPKTHQLAASRLGSSYQTWAKGSSLEGLCGARRAWSFGGEQQAEHGSLWWKSYKLFEKPDAFWFSVAICYYQCSASWYASWIFNVHSWLSRFAEVLSTGILTPNHNWPLRLSPGNHSAKQIETFGSTWQATWAGRWMHWNLAQMVASNLADCILQGTRRARFFFGFLCRKIKIKSIASLIATPQLSPWISCWPVVGPVLDAFTL